MKALSLLLLSALFLCSCVGVVDDLKGTVPDMIMYSLEYDLEPLPDKRPPSAPKSLDIQVFTPDAEYRTNLIRIYAPGENSAALTAYPEYERWIGYPANMLAEKVWSQFAQKYANVYLSPAPSQTDYTLTGYLKHFEEVRASEGNRAYVEVVFYFTQLEPPETIGPFKRQVSEPFNPNSSESAVDFVQAMKKCCTSLTEQMIQDFEREVLSAKK